MPDDRQYAPNEQQVVHEVFNDEILVINLDQGNYFSLRGSGAQIWSMMLAGLTPSAMAQALAAAHGADRAGVAAEVDGFMAQLLEHQLIAVAPAPVQPADGADKIVTTAATFQAPVLEVFTDMQDLLLLDPVHEADDAGWPVKKPDVAAKA